MSEAELRAQRDAVLVLHHPVPAEFYAGPGKRATRMVCDHCDTGDPFCTVSIDWPCPTASALGVQA